MTPITQDNLYLLLPGKVSSVVAFLMSDGENFSSALRHIYTSRMYQQLAREDTKLWNLGPVALYQMLKEEQ